LTLTSLDEIDAPDSMQIIKYSGVPRSFSIGANNAPAVDEESITIGNGNINLSEDGHIFGENNSLQNAAKIAIGYDVDITNAWSFGYGAHIKLRGEYSAAFGKDLALNGTNS